MKRPKSTAVACAALAAATACAATALGAATASGAPLRSRAPRRHDASLSSQTLVIGSQVAPPTLDETANASSAIDEVVDYNVLQHLVQLAPSGAIVPVLASSYTVNKNRSVFTFTLRKGVRFSNGDPLTPADVVFSMKRVMAKNSAYPDASVFDVKAVYARGHDQVRVYLKQPSWSWLFDLAAYSNGAVLDPRTVGTLATDPIGTGPYVVSGTVPNSSVSLQANPSYWGTKPGYAKVEFRYFSDPNAEDAALETGQIQVIDGLGVPSEVRSFRSKRYVIETGLTDGKVQLTINNSAAPFNKVDVRRAIAYAINKAAVNQVAAAGRGLPLGSDAVPGDPYYLDLTSKYPYDPAKAKQLLAKAGYPNGFSTTLTLPPYTYATLAGPVIQSELAAVGIKVTIDSVQFPLWLSQVFESRNFDLTIIDHNKPRDIGNYGVSYYWNYAGTAAVAKMLSRADAASTEAGWIRGTRSVLHLITSQAVNDWLYVVPNISVHRAGIVGLPAFGKAYSFDLAYARPASAGPIPSSERKLGYAGR